MGGVKVCLVVWFCVGIEDTRGVTKLDVGTGVVGCTEEE